MTTNRFKRNKFTFFSKNYKKIIKRTKPSFTTHSDEHRYAESSTISNKHRQLNIFLTKRIAGNDQKDYDKVT